MIQGGQSFSLINWLGVLKSKSSSDMGEQKGLIWGFRNCPVTAANGPSKKAVVFEGQAETHTCGVGHPKDSTAGFKHFVRSKKSKKGLSFNWPWPHIWPKESVGNKSWKKFRFISTCLYFVSDGSEIIDLLFSLREVITIFCGVLRVKTIFTSWVKLGC